MTNTAKTTTSKKKTTKSKDVEKNNSNLENESQQSTVNSDENNEEFLDSDTLNQNTFKVNAKISPNATVDYIHFNQIKAITGADTRTIKKRLDDLNIPYSSGRPMVIKVESIINYLLGRETKSRASKSKSTSALEIDLISAQAGAFGLHGKIHQIDPKKMKFYQEAEKAWIENRIRQSQYIPLVEVKEILYVSINKIISYFNQLQGTIDENFQDPAVQTDIEHWINNTRYDLYCRLMDEIQEYKLLAPYRREELEEKQAFIEDEMEVIENKLTVAEKLEDEDDDLDD